MENEITSPKTQGGIRAWFMDGFARLQTCAHRWWYTPLMGVIAFLSVFLALVPSEVLVVKTVLLKRRGWAWTALIIAVFSAMGAWALGSLVGVFGETLLTGLFGPEIYDSPHLVTARRWIDDFGGLGMALIALSPLPMQPGVALCALGGMPGLEIAAFVFIGRSAKFLIFAYLAAKMPEALQKTFSKKIS